MTIANAKTATSTPSAASTMPYTPESITSARERSENNRRTEARKRLKEDIDRYIKNDQQSIYGVRAKTKKSFTWNLLSRQAQEQALEAATLDVLQRRKGKGLHVSCVYPEFVDYVPHGKPWQKDEERDNLTYKQIDLLESQGFRTGRDEELNDDEPNPFLKKEEGEDTLAMEDSVRYGTEHASRSIESNLPAERYSNSGKRAALPTPKHRSARIASTTRSTNYTAPDTTDEYESDPEGLTSLDSDSSDEEDSDSDTISNQEPPTPHHRVRRPLIAVTRRLPLLPDNSTPTSASASTNPSEPPRHRFSTTKTFRLKAVLRGRIPDEPDTDADDVE